VSTAQTIYDRSPARVQNILTTFRGWQLRRLRYTEHTWKTFDFLSASQYWTPGQFQDYQLERLRKLVSHASENSPYYRQLYS
jgi:phenylacetate-CoA ligase